MQMKYDVIIVGAGPGGIFAAYELVQQNPELNVAVFEAGHSLNKRRCPIDGEKVKTCVNCKSCSIMSGFGGAGAFSDGKRGGRGYKYIDLRYTRDELTELDGNDDRDERAERTRGNTLLYPLEHHRRAVAVGKVSYGARREHYEKGRLK